jgi:cell wall-associated NlpC family hydrolase
MSKITTSAGVLLSMGLVVGLGTPSYATPVAPSEMTERTNSIQTFIANKMAQMPKISRENVGTITVTTYEERVAQHEAAVAYEQAVALAAESAERGAQLLGAARSQLGQYQDCTALVERSLRSLGYSVGDIGPMNFYPYGTVVSPDIAQPGDILMRNGHVAIYSGNGMGVHGGYNGLTVEVPTNPYNFAVVIRI